MSNLKRLSKTGIEYGDLVWNFASGCLNNENGKCLSGNFGCWAYQITNRFKDRYPNGFKPTVYPEALLSPLYVKKPSRILVCFMGDLFGSFDPEQPVELYLPADRIPLIDSLKNHVFRIIKARPEHTFIFLTKQPQNLRRWSPFPENARVGVTVTDYHRIYDAEMAFEEIESSKNFISIEPLLKWQKYVNMAINRMAENYILHWVIIGACTGSKSELIELNKKYPDLILMPWGRNWTLQPPAEWVREIVEAADRTGIPVFLKDNLEPLLCEHVTGKDNTWALSKINLYKGKLWRQEVP